MTRPSRSDVIEPDVSALAAAMDQYFGN